MKVRIILLIFICLASIVFAQQPSFRIGVNFPFRGIEINMHMVFPILQETGVKSYRQMTYPDVAWKQIEPEDDQWNFTYSDSAIFNGLGITAIPTLYGISPSDKDTIGLQVPWNACTEPGCGWSFSDSLTTKDYVLTVVNRYKEGTEFWEISNEMEGKTSFPIGMPTSMFAEFLKMNYRWIKHIDPDAKILLPGMAGTYGLPLSNYQWLRILLENGGGEAFDIMNYHDYNSWWTLPLHFDSVKAALRDYGYENKPIWITESSVSSDTSVVITPNYVSFDEQAADVWRRASVLFASGVERFYWHSFWSGGGDWNEFGLLTVFGKKKKSFYSFKLLIDEIEGFQSVEKISFGNVTNDNESGGNGVWAVKFILPGGEEKYSLWSPDNQSFLLTGINSDAVEVIRTVPVYISPNGESAIFNVDTFYVNSGEINLQLNGFPILVKKINVTDINERENLVKDYDLKQNYPNPFNPSTTIKYSIPNVGSGHAPTVQLRVYDILGREVAALVNKQQKPGNYEVVFKAADLPSGIYFYSIHAGKFNSVKKMVLLR